MELKGQQIAEETLEKKNALVFRSSSPKEEEGCLHGISPNPSAPLADWLPFFTAALKKEPVVVPDLLKPAKTGMLYKAKKNLAGKAATSSLGKHVMKSVIPEDVKLLIKSVRNIIIVVIGEENGSKEVADRLEKNTIKIVVKCYFLWENKILALSEFQKIETPLKQALKLLLMVYDNADKIKDMEMKRQVLEEKFTVIAVLLETVRDNLITLLTPHLKPKSTARIGETFQRIAQTDFLLKAWHDQSLKPDTSYCMTFVRDYVKKL